MQAIMSFIKKKTFAFPLFLLILVMVINFGLQINILGFERFSDRFFVLLNGNLRGFMPLVFLAVAQAIILLSGNIDLSLGSLMSVIAAFMVTRLSFDTSLSRFFLIFFAAIGIGMLGGVINGICVSLIRIPAFITTYATSFIFSGVALWFLPRPGGDMPADAINFYRRTLPLGLPIGIFIIAVLLLIWFLLRNTKFGENLYAIGGNQRAAYKSGVSVVLNKFLIFTLAGVITAFAALFLTLSTGSSDARIGPEMTLNSIVAVVLGGTLLSGGIGGITGPVLGVLILGFIRSIVSFANVNTWFQPLVDALIILGALVAPSIIRLMSKQE